MLLAFVRFAAMGLTLLFAMQSCATADTPVYGEPVALLIQGYNYTDDYIESFTVNGQGGGNIFESGPESGGGKSVCCASYTPGTPLPIRLKIRWTSGYCTYSSTNAYGETYVRRQPRWSETEARIEQPPKGVPRALEVHFYPDGHVEAALTAGDSPPRLKLPRDEHHNRVGANPPRPPCSPQERS